MSASAQNGSKPGADLLRKWQDENVCVRCEGLLSSPGPCTPANLPQRPRHRSVADVIAGKSVHTPWPLGDGPADQCHALPPEGYLQQFCLVRKDHVENRRPHQNYGGLIWHDAAESNDDTGSET